MKATGIVRRIDDLGRVVIPKEIRRTMRIREGDPLEIYTDRDGEVIFKKYSPIGELSVYVGVYTDTIARATGNTVAVTDKDSIIAVSGAYKKELTDKKISVEMEKCIGERKIYVYRIGDKRLPIAEKSSETGTEKHYAGIVCPIITEGDLIGSMILLINDIGTAPGDVETKLLTTASQLLVKQLEA